MKIPSSPVAAPQPAAQRSSAPADKPTSELPVDSAFIGGGGGLSVSSKNGLVSAAAGLITQGIWASGVVPGGTLGKFVSGVATFAVTKGVYHGIAEVQAREAKGMSTDNAFQEGFAHYAKGNIIRGLLHTSIQSMSAGLGPAAFIAGPAVSGALTKFTGY